MTMTSTVIPYRMDPNWESVYINRKDYSEGCSNGCCSLMYFEKGLRGVIKARRDAEALIAANPESSMYMRNVVLAHTFATIDRKEIFFLKSKLRMKKKRKQCDDDMSTPPPPTMTTKKMKPLIDVDPCIITESSLVFPSMHIDDFKYKYCSTTTTRPQVVNSTVKKRSVSFVEACCESEEDQENCVSLRRKKRKVSTIGGEAASINVSTKRSVDEDQQDEEINGSTKGSDDKDQEEEEINVSTKGSDDKDQKEEEEEATDVSTEKRKEKFTCCICLDVPDKMDLAAVDCCSNKFCYNCIKSWTERSCKCPFCRESITCISCVHDKSKTVHPKATSLLYDRSGNLYSEYTVADLSLDDYFNVRPEGAVDEVVYGRVIGLEAWLMTGDHAGYREADVIPDRCEEVLDGLLDASKREQWGLTEAQAQVFEVHLRAMHSVREEMHHGKEYGGYEDRLEALEKAMPEILSAQQEGPTAVQQCLETYRKKRFYTRDDIMHCYYKRDTGELLERKFGPNPTISRSTLLQFNADLRATGREFDLNFLRYIPPSA